MRGQLGTRTGYERYPAYIHGRTKIQQPINSSDELILCRFRYVAEERWLQPRRGGVVCSANTFGGGAVR